ncbi:endolytic transglycosylase MltG [Limnobacter litoralis]|uniref:endolytic transglycosylase MltG n=1 Tax=Limnobacter litoralis TaxID=481366 RepID=UPI0024E18061|nr:endolytic transglycosylase MltG [Limnobacter litoralis]
MVHPKKKKQKTGTQAKPRPLLILSILAFIVLAFAGLVYGLLSLDIPREKAEVYVRIEQGFSARQVGKALRSSGLEIEPSVFVLAANLLHAGNKLKAGYYSIPPGLNTLQLIDYLKSGKGMVFDSITFVEGSTALEILTNLKNTADLRDDLGNASEPDLARRFNLESGNLEGWISPDTFKYSPGTKLSEVLINAIELQKSILDKAWASRDLNVPLNNPYEALILASIVEKETGRASDRAAIASVFENRLKAGMPLQTDPTVIYGLGKAFNGNLTRKHLETDGIYNTYLRTGLPPTPICSPGKAALEAVLHPAKTNYYYFVARGDGTTHFSENLSEHNVAVRKYQLGK